MKVLHFITGLNTGGAEMMLYRLLSATDRKRFDPVVVSLMDRGTLGDRIAALGIPVHAIGMRRDLFSAIRLFRLWRILRRERPDVLQAWMYHANLLGLILGRLARIKHVVWGLHHTDLDPQKDKRTTIHVAKVCAPLSRWTDAIVSCSQVATRMHVELGYQAEKMRFIPNGFDLERFHPDPKARYEVRRELGLAEKAVLIGLVARFAPQKDHHSFLRAASRLLHALDPAKPIPEVLFLLCGRDVDDSNAQLMRWVQQLGLRRQVHLLGLRQDIPELSAALDIATSSSSRGEAFPLVVGEAMACGVPCVVTDVGDSALIVGETGLVVPPGDPEALAAAWKQMLDMGAEDRRALGAAARRRIQKRFSLPATVAKYEDLYEELAAHGTRTA